MIRPEAFALIAAALSVPCAIRWPAHRPVALVLCLSAARDVLGAIVSLPCRLDLAWLLCVACASGWAYERAWRPMPGPLAGARTSWPLWLFLAAVSVATSARVGAAELAAWTREAPTIPAVLAALAGVHGFAAEARAGRASGVERETCLVLLAGDVGGLLSGFDDRTLAAHATLQLLAVSLVQVAWLARPKDAAS